MCGIPRLSAPALLVLLVAVAPAAPAREDHLSEYHGSGNDYINAAVRETFTIARGRAVDGDRIYDPARIEQALGIAPRDRG
jgi:hypothetical protein